MKLMTKKFRRALADDGDVMEVLAESFGDKNAARICLSYLSVAAATRKEWWRFIRWFWFWSGVTLGLLISLLISLLIGLFS